MVRVPSAKFLRETVCGVNFESGCVFHLMGTGKKGESREWGRGGEGFSIDGRKHGRGGGRKGKEEEEEEETFATWEEEEEERRDRVAKSSGKERRAFEIPPGGVDSLLPSRMSHPKRVFEKRGRKKVLQLVNLMME